VPLARGFEMRGLQWCFVFLSAAWSGVALSADPARPFSDSIAERVIACASCHGAQGRATSEGYFPRIAGKPAGYLYNQLVNFRDGRRDFPPMAHLVEYLTNDYLGEMSRYFDGLKLPYPPPEKTNLGPESERRAQVLVRKGDPSRKLPACVSCHGDNLLGAKPFVPGLLGLSRHYLGAQMAQWKNGVRRALAPDCMANVASALTLEEIGDIAAWLASQPVPADPKPLTRLMRPLPLSCGSVGP
jgi:cytochrome c553